MSATSGIVIAQGFPYQRTGAKYVWTARQGKGTLNKIMLRHVIGGERCRPEQLQSKNMATISFAADNRAWVFLNGRLLAKNFRPRTVKTIRKGLKPGDVIAVGTKNMGGASGVIVDVFYKGDHFATGRGHWKARKYRASLRRRWRLKQYSSCKWKDPVIVDTAANLITAPQFPSSSGARYVWAPPYGRGMKSASLLRFVVGGEKCPRKTNVAVGGQSEGEKERFCRCKMTTGREGTCYDMVSATRKRGRCKVRQCETKYECVANSAKGSKVCIRRVASEKVIPSGKPGRCIRVGSDSIFYVPYE